MTRVRVVAESAVGKAGLEALLAPDFELVEEGAEVAVVDAEDWDDEGVSEWAALAPAVLLLAPDPADAAALLRAGVRGVLPRDVDARELSAAVIAVAAGLIVLHPGTQEAALAPARARVVSTLTPREIEVLRLLAAGEGNKQIAYRLGVTEHTAKFHVASILSKLGAGSRTEAVAIGIRQGIVML